ncbi:MAG: hypothetical protein INR71_13390, partial [Terriglobus roseus]|nr:hypothetical protein [Terriglobus roseus]
MSIKGRIATAIFAGALIVPALSMAQPGVTVVGYQYGNGYGQAPAPPPQGPGGW